jgi:transcriptional regulator with XRE-family HTH domain
VTSFIAQNLRKIRQTRGVSESTLAQQLGVAEDFIRDIENGRFVPSLYATRLIAETLNAPLASLFGRDAASWLPSDTQRYYSVFISYGSPDELFARALYEAFVRRGVHTFFFPETARAGQRLHRTMSQGVNEYDRILLLCSRSSLERPGVLNELDQVLAREAREGGSELLIPVTIDDYVFTKWSPTHPDIAFQVKDRVVADFRGVSPGSIEFDVRFARLLKSLEITA